VINPVISPMLQPVTALVLWTFVMWAWMYATRIPAIQAAGQALPPDMTAAQFDALIPARVRWKADNYNHLHEQPTLFYAVALTLAVAGAGSGWALWLAWAYVAIRIAHSLIHALGNVILVRFAVFNVGSVVLLALAARAAWVVFA
jgi:hypothetical protein